MHSAGMSNFPSATLDTPLGTHFAENRRNPSAQALPLSLDKPMNVYPEEIADPRKSAKISPKIGGGTAAVSNSSDTDRRGKSLMIAAFVSSVALAMALGIWSLSRQLTPKPASPEATALAVLPEKSIAVLPLENLTEDKGNAFLADGVQDDIRTALAKVADLKVINRTSVNTYVAGTRRNLPEIAQTL